MSKETEFSRICPDCKTILFYTTLKICKTAIKKNSICKKCSNSGSNNPNFGKSPSIETREKLRIANTGKKRTEETKNKLSIALIGKNNPMFGKPGFWRNKKFSKETKAKIGIAKTGISLSTVHKENIRKSQIGKKHTDKTKCKQRVSKINYIIKCNGSIRPTYNNIACKYFELLEIENNWDGFYGTKNKEYHIKQLGYFVDYYEPSLNIVIEYDEPLHYNINNTLKSKDVIRMNEIKLHLSCDFYRYNERLKTLIKY